MRLTSVVGYLSTLNKPLLFGFIIKRLFKVKLNGRIWTFYVCLTSAGKAYCRVNLPVLAFPLFISLSSSK